MKKVLYLIMAAVIMFGGCKTEEESNKQGGIHGVVTDRATGEPINAAAVLLTPGGEVKITGSDGMYNFSAIKSDKYEIKVFKEGYLSSNQSIDVSSGKDIEAVVTLTKSSGKLTFNKAYIDMGSNESNNTAGFSIINSGDVELAWSITNAVSWITKVDPASGTTPALGAEAVVITIDRNRLSANISDNYATLVLRSTTSGDGSTAELLVTVFGSGNGTGITISDDDYVVIDGLYVQTKDLGGEMTWNSAMTTCQTSTIGGYNDWYLPSIGELALLYSKKEIIGGFKTSSPSGYWSSTPYNSYYSLIYFADGSEGYNNSSYSYRCRCVRKSSPLPVVSTLPTTNITANAATLNGKIENKGDPVYTERGFVYSKTFQNPSIEDDASATTKRIVSGTNTEFSANISELTTETTYFVRAYATNINGTAYGESISFKATSEKDYIILEADGIMVQKYDISSGADWNTAKSMCESSRVGGFSDWRLPTIGELMSLCNQKSTIGGFNTTSSGSQYWSSTPYSSSAFYAGNFYNCSKDYRGSGNSYRVRAVRSLP